MTEHTNGAAFYPHDFDKNRFTPRWKIVQIAVRTNREEEHSVLGFRPEDIVMGP